ncbi:MAG: rod shape-determining protein MreD [Candidatus Parcubacteria bacterium]|nr:rod shape-determining protein MreD [Burkholderiales bacterium]
MQLSDSSSSQRILLPVRARTILGSFALALFANFLPWSNVALAPDLVALVLVFWCVRQPRLVGLGAGWLLGLLIDAGNGVLMGQHALAYSLLAFGAITLSRRILWFTLWSQALHVAALLLFAQGVSALVRIAAGADFPGWEIAVGPLVGAVLWPVVSLLLLMPQRMPADVDETRAI